MRLDFTIRRPALHMEAGLFIKGCEREKAIMAVIKVRTTDSNRAATYARVSSMSQAQEDKTSTAEQIAEMEAYCEQKGLKIVARYQEVGKGWSKKRPEFQRMLADAKTGRFDTIVCWKSDRLSRGMYPAAALMEVVDAHQIRLEAVMDAIDIKTFGLMAAIGKIELDNFRERASLGKRGAAKQGRIPSGRIPYGYRIGDGGKPEVVEDQAEVVRRIFQMYVNEGLGVASIRGWLFDEGIPTAQHGKEWSKWVIHRVLSNTAYKGVWSFGRTRQVSTETGRRIYERPRDNWIDIPFPPLVDEDIWERAQELKKKRIQRSKRNTKAFYLLQGLLRCSECGFRFTAISRWGSRNRRNGKLYAYEYDTPRRYYRCLGMDHRLDGRKRPSFRAEQLEQLVWSEVKKVLQNPGLIMAGIESLDGQDNGGLAEEIARTERDLRNVQMEEDRAIRLYVTGKITEEQLDHQRKFITERLENLRAQLDEYRVREASGGEKRALLESVLAWAEKIGEGLDEISPHQRREMLQLVLDEVTIDRNNKVRIPLAIPVEDSVSIASQSSRKRCCRWNSQGIRSRARSPRQC